MHTLFIARPDLLAIFGLGSTELIVVFAIVVLLFGGAKLPGLARGLGQSMKEFKKASKDEKDEVETPALIGAPKKEIPSDAAVGKN